MKTRKQMPSGLYELLDEPPADWIREKIAELLHRRGAGCERLAAELLIQFAKRDLDADPGDPRLRVWHDLVLDLRATIEASAAAEAEMLAMFADLLEKTIRLAARNPADQLVSRPSSRRVLLALHERGGLECSFAEVREASGMSQSHFSNVVRILRAAGVAESNLDRGSGREKRLSLTIKGLALIASDSRRRPSRAELPKVSVESEPAPRARDRHPAPRTVVYDMLEAA
jgi:DNA-binding MarR family transcriptional regulator